MLNSPLNASLLEGLEVDEEGRREEKKSNVVMVR